VLCQVGVLNWGQITTNTQDILTNSEKATNLGVITSLCRKTAPVKTYIILSLSISPPAFWVCPISLNYWLPELGGGQGGVKKRKNAAVNFTKSYPQLRSKAVYNCSPKVYEANTALFT